MLNKKIEDAINYQINAELWSAYLYLSMSLDCASKGLQGAANWFEIQYQEEQAHAMKFKNYIIARGGRVVLQPIQEVQTEWNTLLDIFKDTLAHEQKVTALLNNLYKIALEETDVATQSMLKWFIDEQVEEEENATSMIDALKMIGDNGYGLYMLDKELSTRVFVPIPA
ncbi:MAG: ferritin [Bacteroidetes bacterium HGW-Bacteroidetes-6]|nr:MAG: ferritin [Bacteroidetes bacterium HGW-Bacteroidetes-6]